MIFRRRADTEELYRRGVQAWRRRDLERAVADLEGALNAARHPEDVGWWFSARRVLAQIAMEQDDPVRAARYLEGDQGTGVGNAQQQALVARLYRQQGDFAGAQMAVSSAVEALLRERGDHPGVLMDGAIALMWCGQVLVELGFGQEAARITEIARRRMQEADADDAVLDAGLSLVEAGSARLVDDLPRATATLAIIDQSVSPELGIQVKCETARLAWVGGDRGAARSLYGEAAAEAERLGYPALVRLAEAEALTGPILSRSEGGPIEEWVARRTIGKAADLRPYAVVARLVVDGSLEDYFDVEGQVAEVLADRPNLGVVDGSGTDGHIWELFLDGDDPDALWEAVAPTVAKLAVTGSRVDLRRGDEVQTIPLP